MPDLIFKYDTYQLNDLASGLTVARARFPEESRIPFEEPPRRHGAFVTEEPTLRPRYISLEGQCKKSTAALSRAELRSLTKVLNGTNKRLFFWDDAYVNAYKSRIEADYPAGAGWLVFRFTIDILCADPFFYDPTVQSVVQAVTGWPTSSTTWSISNGGDYLVYPSLTIANNTGASVSSITLTNNTVGKAWTYVGTLLNGQSLVVNHANLTVLNNGVADPNNWSGVFWWLAVGTNSITMSSANGSVTATFQHRFFAP